MTYQKINMVRAQLMGALPDILSQAGGDKVVRIAFERQELPIELCRMPGQWMPMLDMLGLFEQAARFTADPIISLRVAQATDMAGYGAPGAYLSASRAFEEFGRRLIAVLGQVQTGTIPKMHAVGEVGAMTLEWPSTARIGRIHMGLRFVILVRQALFRFFGDATEIHWIALETGDRRLQALLEDELAVPVHIDQRHHGIFFPRKYLDGPAVGSHLAADDPALDRVGYAYASSVPDADIEAVREVVKLRLLAGRTDLDGAARRLRVGRRTLQRMLARNDLSFREIVHDALMDRAFSLLSDPDVTVRGVSETLGYSEPSHFIRAFRRRFGMSPGALRRT